MHVVRAKAAARNLRAGRALSAGPARLELICKRKYGNDFDFSPTGNGATNNNVHILLARSERNQHSQGERRAHTRRAAGRGGDDEEEEEEGRKGFASVRECWFIWMRPHPYGLLALRLALATVWNQISCDV